MDIEDQNVMVFKLRVKLGHSLFWEKGDFWMGERAEV